MENDHFVVLYVVQYEGTEVEGVFSSEQEAKTFAESVKTTTSDAWLSVRHFRGSEAVAGWVLFDAVWEIDTNV